MAARIHVTIPDETERGYPIVIEKGALAHMSDLMGEFGLDGRAGIITNATLAPLYGERLRDALPDAGLLTMPDGEQYKSLETVSSLYEQMIRAGLDRNSTVIALGGGVVGDTAGFAAATFMRGIRFVQIPTSLLAMVDSSVGGKVGIDLPAGKNLVGAFLHPAAVLIDPEVLHTLPEREWRCGMAEVIKHGLLADPILLDMASSSRSATSDDEALIARAVQIKVDVVQRDPYEKGERAHLNLGHTFAHAIEIVSDFRWQHGEAVALGLIAATRLSRGLGLCGDDVVRRAEYAVERCGLPMHMGELDPETIWATMGTDKKWKGGKSRFVLLRSVAQPTIVEQVQKDDVLTILEALR